MITWEKWGRANGTVTLILMDIRFYESKPNYYYSGTVFTAIFILVKFIEFLFCLNTYLESYIRIIERLKKFYLEFWPYYHFNLSILFVFRIKDFYKSTRIQGGYFFFFNNNSLNLGEIFVLLFKVFSSIFCWLQISAFTGGLRKGHWKAS